MARRKPKPPLVQCVSCGFFGKHALPTDRLIPTPTFYEVERPDREAGRVFKHVPDTLVGEVPTEPICYRRIIDYPADVQRLSAEGHEREQAVVALLTEERHCDEWFEYVWGLNPMQHLGGKAAQDAEKRQREWERLLSQDTKRFQTEIAKEGEKTQRAMLDVSKSQRRWSIAAVAAGTIAAVITAVITIVLTRPAGIRDPLPVVVVQPTATSTASATAAAESTPTLVPQSTPDTARSPTSPAP